MQGGFSLFLLLPPSHPETAQAPSERGTVPASGGFGLGPECGPMQVGAGQQSGWRSPSVALAMRDADGARLSVRPSADPGMPVQSISRRSRSGPAGGLSAASLVRGAEAGEALRRLGPGQKESGPAFCGLCGWKGLPSPPRLALPAPQLSSRRALSGAEVRRRAVGRGASSSCALPVLAEGALRASRPCPEGTEERLPRIPAWREVTAFPSGGAPSGRRPGGWRLRGAGPTSPGNGAMTTP